MSESLYGITTIGEFDYPYGFEQETERVTIYTGTNLTKLPNEVDKIVGQKLGMLAGGCTLYKLGVPLSNDFPANQANQVRYIDYLIENYQENCKYTEMRFHFPELDYFMPSARIFNCDEKQCMFSKVIDTVCAFSIQYHGSEISVSFNIKATSNIGVKAKVESVSEVVLKFSDTDDLEFLIDLYFATRAFFTFVFNRQNIGLRSAIIIGKYPRKTIKDRKPVDIVSFTEQKLVLSQRYLEALEEDKQIAKVPKIGLFFPKIKELFQLFFEENVGDSAVVDWSSIHSSFKYRNFIDLKQSLHITAAFEYYVRTQLPEISSKDTIDFYDDIKNLLDEYIKNNKGAKRRKAKSFRKLLIPQVSLKEKILKSYNGYSTADGQTWEPLKPILSKWFGENIEELAGVANLWRNELAHEKREFEPDESVIAAIRLIEHINYCIVLRRAGYNDTQIKAIISDILSKPI